MTVRRIALVLLVLLVGAWPPVASAQSATPTMSGTAPFDLAAMALAPQDVPAGYFDDYSEWWVPPAAFSESVLAGAATPPGLERVYESFYGNPDEARTIHVFLFQFASVEAAEAGTSLVDLALRPPLPEGTTLGPTHVPGPDLGEAPLETTLVSYDTWAGGGPRVDVVADAFRRDRLLVGVSVETYTDPPEAGTLVATPARPATPDPAQEQLVTKLATTLDRRIMAALVGQALEGVDPALADAALPLDQLVDAQTPILGGYKAGIDLLRCGICGEANSLVRFADDARGGFTRVISLGPLVDGEPQPPFVLVAVSDFTAPETALQVLDAIRQAPNDLPTPGPIPRGTRTLVDDPTIPGAQAALAFQATSAADDPNAPVDSAGVDFVVGNRLATVDVLGGLSTEAAIAAAIDLATQQAGCLTADSPCALVTRPSAIPATPSS